MPAAIKLTEEEENKICELYQSGASFRDIWKSRGYTQGVTKKVLIKHGIAVRDKVGARAAAREKAEHVFIPREKEKYIENPNQPPINCKKQGKKCMYKRRTSGINTCDYCIIIGHSRGCSPEECTKYRFERKSR